VAVHELVKANENIGAGRRKGAIFDTVGSVLNTRLNKLRDFAGGGKEQRKHWFG